MSASSLGRRGRRGGLLLLRRHGRGGGTGVLRPLLDSCPEPFIALCALFLLIGINFGLCVSAKHSPTAGDRCRGASGSGFLARPTASAVRWWTFARPLGGAVITPVVVVPGLSGAPAIARPAFLRPPTGVLPPHVVLPGVILELHVFQRLTASLWHCRVLLLGQDFFVLFGHLFEQIDRLLLRAWVARPPPLARRRVPDAGAVVVACSRDGVLAARQRPLLPLGFLTLQNLLVHVLYRCPEAEFADLTATPMLLPEHWVWPVRSHSLAEVEHPTLPAPEARARHRVVSDGRIAEACAKAAKSCSSVLYFGEHAQGPLISDPLEVVKHRQSLRGEELL
mmetsp:Transcript_23269/g.65109  ORF Transcript_23269/g.65109 Transcript_23269/m.65109 type:complete len:337 (+) Transcript_23269:239-1249(+)